MPPLSHASSPVPFARGCRARPVAALAFVLLALAAPPDVAAEANPPPAEAPAAADQGAPTAASRAALRADLGQPSVVSQRGQRLKVALPYGAAPGERLSPLQVWVEAVETSDGSDAPAARGFTVMQAERRNLLWLRSREPVTASRVTLVLRVAGRDEPLRYELPVPPVRFAPPERNTAASS